LAYNPHAFTGSVEIVGGQATAGKRNIGGRHTPGQQINNDGRLAQARRAAPTELSIVVGTKTRSRDVKAARSQTSPLFKIVSYF
jgi:hypothetical protein